MSFRFVEWNVDELREMRLVKKMSYPEIGRALKVHHTTVMARCWLFGIEERPAPQGQQRAERVAMKLPQRVGETLFFTLESAAQARRWRDLLAADAARRRALGLAPDGFAAALKPRRQLPSILTERPRVTLQMPEDIAARAVNDDAQPRVTQQPEARLVRR